MVCHGRGCDVTFKSCTFLHSALVVLGAASVTLTDCKFIQPQSQKGCSSIPGRSNIAGGRNVSRGHRGSVFLPTDAMTETSCPESKGFGISMFVLGGGTRVCMESCHVTGGVQGLAVQERARLEAKQLSVAGVSGTGIEVIGAGTKAVLHACMFQACRSRPQDLEGGSVAS